MLAWRERGSARVSALLKRVFDRGHIGEKTWCIPVVLLMPAVTGLAYGPMYATARRPAAGCAGAGSLSNFPDRRAG
jgi:hypothetical protein